MTLPTCRVIVSADLLPSPPTRFWRREKARRGRRWRGAVHFLENSDIIGIYPLGLRANVWPLIPSASQHYKPYSDRDAGLIVGGMQTGEQNPLGKGFWDYGNGLGTNLHGSVRFDHSVSQYGVLGLWACAQGGSVINRSVWEQIDAGWKKHQGESGGWAYDSAPANPGSETASMTAAGVATLFITDDILNAGQGAEPRGNVTNDHIERGLAWISSHFDSVNNAYAFYGVERIGAASGRKFLGDNDWYSIGAEKLVRLQKPDGSWVGGFPGAENPVPPTAFALIFLSRGRDPVMMNKLQYRLSPGSADARPADARPADTGSTDASVTPQQTVDANWNQRPRDVANLTRWVGNRIEHNLNWQTVSLMSSLEDLHEAPVLYMSGDQELSFTPDEMKKLRAFVESGGLILANADAGAAHITFANSFEAMGRKLFPAYAFREMAADHPVFVNEQYPASRWKNVPRVRALSNGVRELLVLIPEADPARAWQLHDDKANEPLLQLGADIFEYAIDKQNLRFKGDTYFVRPDPNIMADRSARIGRLAIGDNWNPEPGSWRRLAAILHNDFKLDLNVENVKIGDNRLSKFKLLHLTGTGRFILTPAIREQLVEYVWHGGTLLFDAAGGNAEFGDSAVEELTACFGEDAVKGLREPLALDHPVFNLPGAAISEVSYREVYRRHGVGNLKTPRLNAISVRGRPAVFLSRQDLTAGMVGEPVDGIRGYTPQSATDIMRNIVMFSCFSARPVTGK